MPLFLFSQNINTQDLEKVLDICKEKFDVVSTFQANNEWATKYDEFAKKNSNSTSNITYQECREIEYEIIRRLLERTKVLEQIIKRELEQ